MQATPEQDGALESALGTLELKNGAQVSSTDRSELQNNAEKLANLERERANLGPLRRIKFTSRFFRKDFAEQFTNLLDPQEWRVRVVNRGSPRDWYVTATRLVEPDAEDITKWEDFFENHSVMEQSYYGGGAYYRGWEYCDKQDVSFSPSKYFDVDAFAADRADVLFGVALAQDRLDGHKWNTWPAAAAPPFRLHPGEFARDAQNRRPSNPQPTASGFSQWLYSLYSNANGSAEDRAKGKDAEQAVMDARLRAYGSIECNSVRYDHAEWKLVHNGLHLRDEENLRYYDVPVLSVGGSPLRASPDLVFRNTHSDEVIIVEIKHSRMSIPENLWPNIWGQLWCYAQIETVRDAPKITVVGEVWGDGWAKHSDRLVCLRASVRRDPRNPAYDRFFRRLFDIYRGVL